MARELEHLCIENLINADQLSDKCREGKEERKEGDKPADVEGRVRVLRLLVGGGHDAEVCGRQPAHAQDIAEDVG